MCTVPSRASKRARWHPDEASQPGPWEGALHQAPSLAPRTRGCHTGWCDLPWGPAGSQRQRCREPLTWCPTRPHTGAQSRMSFPAPAPSSPALCTKVAVCPDSQRDGADAMCPAAAQTSTQKGGPSPTEEFPSKARPAEAEGQRPAGTCPACLPRAPDDRRFCGALPAGASHQVGIPDEQRHG